METLQHLNVKIFAQEPASIEWHHLIPVFHRWIQDRRLPENLIDVADYAHVPSGPGVMLIGHEAFYSLDNRQSRPGLLYNRRTSLDGSAAEKLAQAYDAALAAARTLASEHEFSGKIQFDEGHCEVFVNDRLLAPNTESTWQQLEGPISSFFEARWGSRPSLTWQGQSRDLFRVTVRSRPE